MTSIWLLSITLTLLLASLAFLLLAAILERAKSHIRQLERRIEILTAELNSSKRALQMAERKVASLSKTLRAMESQREPGAADAAFRVDC